MPGKSVFSYSVGYTQKVTFKEDSTTYLYHFFIYKYTRPKIIVSFVYKIYILRDIKLLATKTINKKMNKCPRKLIIYLKSTVYHRLKHNFVAD